MNAAVRSDGAAVVAILLLAWGVVATGLGNGFALDDAAVIVQNTALHSPQTALARVFEPYLAGQLLRPVPQLGFAIQWWVGGGNPLVFRLVSTGLYALVCVLVLLLCRRMGASPTAALLGASAFTVHPVHSEVTANGVGQLELLTTLLVLVAVLWYLRARASRAWRRSDTLVIATALALATHSKEVGYVLPFLLIAVEVLAVRDPTPWRLKVGTLREPALVLAAVVVGSLAMRSHFLGSLGGGDAHRSLTGSGLVGRAQAVLLFAPEWARLLVWPARLQAEYGPPALDPRSAFGVAHLLGLLLLLIAIMVVVRCWRRQPLVSLGFVWIAIGLAPVANLFFPTGVLVAERTLFLPSVGLAVLVAASTGHLWPLVDRGTTPRAVLLGLVVAVLTLAGWRSAVRQPDWRDTVVLLSRDSGSAPETYRLHFLLGQELRYRGSGAAAEAAFRRATELWVHDPRPFHDLGQLLRARGECAQAIPILSRGVLADSTSDVARSRLVECLIVERRWDEAEREVNRGLAQGVTGYRNALGRVEAGRRADLPK